MKRFPFFNTISKESQELLQKHSMEAKMPENMELFNQDEKCKNILFLTNGLVRVYRRHISGKEITLYYLRPFEQCNVNLNSALSNTPAIGTAITVEEIEGLMIPSEIIKEVYAKEEAYQQYIFDMFSLRLENLAILIEDLRFEKIDNRLMKWIESQNNDIIHTTHEELASHLGTSREVISRLLKKFEQEGIVELARGIIKKL